MLARPNLSPAAEEFLALLQQQTSQTTADGNPSYDDVAFYFEHFNDDEDRYNDLKRELVYKGVIQLLTIENTPNYSEDIKYERGGKASKKSRTDNLPQDSHRIILLQNTPTATPVTHNDSPESSNQKKRKRVPTVTQNKRVKQEETTESTALILTELANNSAAAAATVEVKIEVKEEPRTPPYVQLPQEPINLDLNLNIETIDADFEMLLEDSSLTANRLT